MDIIKIAWDWALDFVYTGRYSPVHSLLFRLGLWNMLALGLFTLAWENGVKSVFVNSLVFYLATTIVFSMDFAFLHRLWPQVYIFLLIAAAISSVRLPDKVAFYLSPYAGAQAKIAIFLRWLFWGLIIVQVILCVREG